MHHPPLRDNVRDSEGYTHGDGGEASEGPGLVHWVQQLLPWELRGNKSLVSTRPSR